MLSAHVKVQSMKYMQSRPLNKIRQYADLTIGLPPKTLDTPRSLNFGMVIRIIPEPVKNREAHKKYTIIIKKRKHMHNILF